MYEYNAKVNRVVDGDTVDLTIDLGCCVSVKERVRLYGINAPETRGKERPEGLIAKQFLIDLLPVGTDIVIKTLKDKRGKYGRYVVTLFLDGLDLNVHMVDTGHAVFKEY